MSVELFKVCLVLPECPIFRNLPEARSTCRCSKIICRELHFVIFTISNHLN